MSFRTSKHFCAVPTGELIKELIHNKSVNMDEFQKTLELSNDELWDLLEGDLPVDENLAEDLSKVLDTSSNIFIKWEKTYRAELARVNQENASPVFETV